MNKEQRPEYACVGGGLVEKPTLLSLVPVKWLEIIRPLVVFFNVEKGIFKVCKQPVDPLVKTPEQNGSNHVGHSKRRQNHLVHWSELHGSRGCQQHAKHDQVMIETGDALLGNHVEVPKCAVVLVKNGHIGFLHNSLYS